MQLKAILNHVQKFKSFVYKRIRWAGSDQFLELEIEVVEQSNSLLIYPECGKRRPGYDRQPLRRFDFVPLWGIKAFLVYQTDAHCKRLLWIGNERKVKTLLRFFRWLGRERSQSLKYLCSDMLKTYLKVIAKKASQAIHVLDRYHIMAHFSKALDEVRAEETKELKTKGYEPVLSKSRWLLLRRPENLTDSQEVKLAAVLQYNLSSIRSYLLKEEFQLFWNYKSAHWAGKFMDQRATKTLRSKIDPMKKVARMLSNHRELLLNWFRAKGQLSSGVVEGFNNKAKLPSRKSFGFRTFPGVEIALYHALGAFPEPEGTHRFF